jgi:transcriptional regulator with GAF, ATPase, and Fis domain
MARLIHAADKQRSQANLVLVDCTTIRTELSGSEFFGHEKGSYTGAEHSREGAFALADNGCLFLDEVGEMPLRMQAELLRVIQEGVYKKLGSNAWRQTDFRLISATNRQLEEESEKGAFRKDLYDRISLWKCNMPSLHQRREDIPALVQFFLRKRFPEEEIPVIDPAVLDYLKERDYYGNIRELQHLVHRITMRYVGKGPITLGDIPEMDRQFFIPVKKSWHEHPELAGAIAEALQNGYDVKSIMDTIKSLITRTALSFSDSNKEVSHLLGKSERWIQLQKARER